LMVESSQNMSGCVRAILRLHFCGSLSSATYISPLFVKGLHIASSSDYLNCIQSFISICHIGPHMAKLRSSLHPNLFPLPFIVFGELDICMGRTESLHEQVYIPAIHTVPMRPDPASSLSCYQRPSTLSFPADALI
jgi:hypothetical protein